MGHCVFLDIARVVGEHDQADAKDFRDRPKHSWGSEQPGKNLVACQRDKAAHNDAADRFSKREIGNRRFTSRIENNENRADSTDCKGNQSSMIDHIAAQDAVTSKAMAYTSAQVGIHVVVDQAQRR